MCFTQCSNKLKLNETGKPQSLKRIYFGCILCSIYNFSFINLNNVFFYNGIESNFVNIAFSIILMRSNSSAQKVFKFFTHFDSNFLKYNDTFGKNFLFFAIPQMDQKHFQIYKIYKIQYLHKFTQFKQNQRAEVNLDARINVSGI